MANSYLKIQLRSGNTVSIPTAQFFAMTDEEVEELYASEYGHYVSNVFESSIYNNTESSYEKLEDLDMDLDDD